MEPTFLCIGAPKSGTTWLAQQLRTHPQIWIPRRKEIHYFDVEWSFPFAAALFSPQPTSRRWARIRISTALKHARTQPDVRSWYLRYFLMPRSDRWYLSLFQPGPGQIAGELTPNYAAIAESAIAKVRALLPDVKLIYLLRNPVDRICSEYAFYLTRGVYRHAQSDNGASIFWKINQEKHMQESRYATNLKRWLTNFPANQLFVGFFEQLRDDPGQLLRDIYAHLGVDTDVNLSPAALHEKVNVSDEVFIPAGIKRSLAREFVAEVIELHELLAAANGLQMSAYATHYVDGWREAMQGAVDQPR